MKKFFKNFVLIVVVFTAGFFARTIEPAYAGSNSLEKELSLKSGSAPSIAPRILWVNTDSIDLKYKAFANLADKAGVAYSEKQKEYQDKAESLQQRYNQLVSKEQRGLISASQAQFEEFSISLEMADLKVLETQIQEMEENAMKKNAEITEGVTLFLKNFSLRKKADYILACGGTSNVLYANPAFEVTDEVITGLNMQYDQKGK
jgi:outer membrane protein